MHLCRYKQPVIIPQIKDKIETIGCESEQLIRRYEAIDDYENHRNYECDNKHP